MAPVPFVTSAWRGGFTTPQIPCNGMERLVSEVAAPSKNPEALSPDKALTAVLALLIAEREERLAASANGSARKTEVILAGSGLNANEIAPLVGKNLDAVRKTIQRWKGT